MRGHNYSEPEPVETCPYCGAECLADFVDVGIGMMQCGPFRCESCLASEIGPYDQPCELTTRERETNWYAPGSEPGSSANVVAGRIVSHQTMRTLYRAEFTGNPDYEKPGAVEDWRERTRRGD